MRGSRSVHVCVDVLMLMLMLMLRLMLRLMLLGLMGLGLLRLRLRRRRREGVADAREVGADHSLDVSDVGEEFLWVPLAEHSSPLFVLDGSRASLFLERLDALCLACSNSRLLPLVGSLPCRNRRTLSRTHGTTRTPMTPTQH